jgi:hypothetical protein
MISTKEITPQSAIDVTLFSFSGLSVKREPLFIFGVYAFTGKGVQGWVGSLKGDFY